MPRAIYPRAYLTGSSPIFSLGFGSSGVNALPTDLTINSITKSPALWYNAPDATASDWAAGYGPALALSGTGGDPTVNYGSPYIGDMNDSVFFINGKYYAESGVSFALGNDDFIIETLAFANSAVQYGTILGQAAAFVPPVWLWGTAPGGGFGGFFWDGSANQLPGTGVLPVQNAWYHIMFFMDKDGSMQHYVNGVATGAALVTSLGSLSSSHQLSAGGTAAGAFGLDNTPVAYAALWHHPNWLDTHLQTTLAQERFYRVCGMYPDKVQGTPIPEVATRSTTAYVDKVEPSGARRMYKMPPDHPRVCQREDTLSNLFTGYLSEGASTNEALQSQDFTVSGVWVPAQVTTTADLIMAPDNTLTADGINEDSTAAATHTITQQFTPTGGTSYTWSAWLHSSNREWCILSFNSPTDSISVVSFDVTNGVAGFTFAIDDYGIEDWGNGWYRCWIRQVRNTAELTDVAIWLADGDLGFTFNGLSQLSLYVWGAQLEEGVSAPTSYIPTSATTDNRTADALYYKADDGNVVPGGGSMEASVLWENADVITNPYVLTLSDGGATADRIALLHAAGDQGEFLGAATAGDGWDITGTSEISDGNQHTLRGTWKTDNANLYVDASAEGTPDTSCDIPDDLDRLHVGTDENGLLQPNGLISTVKIFKKPTKP